MWMWVNAIEDKEGLDQLVHDMKMCQVTDVVFIAFGYNGFYVSTSAYNMCSTKIGGKTIMEYLADLLHANGQRLHAWLCMGTWNDMWAFRKVAIPTSWNCASVSGKVGNWMNFGLSDVRTAMIAFVSDLVNSNTYLDGIHLDYIRYETGASKADSRFSASDITTTVTAIKGVVGSKKLTVAGVPYDSGGYPGYNFDCAGCSQKWAEWIDSGLVDKVLIMNYVRPDTLQIYINGYSSFSATRKSKMANGICNLAWETPPLTTAEWQQEVDIHDQSGLELCIFDYQSCPIENRLIAIGQTGLHSYSELCARSLRIKCNGKTPTFSSGTATEIRRQIEGVVGRYATNLFIHRNRDGTIALAIEQEPSTWPEDRP